MFLVLIGAIIGKKRLYRNSFLFVTVQKNLFDFLTFQLEKKNFIETHFCSLQFICVNDDLYQSLIRKNIEILLFAD